MLRTRLIALTAAALLGCGAAVALADIETAPAGYATLTPDTPGAPSHLLIDAEGPGGGLEAGNLPQSLSFSFQNGFTLTPSAVGGVCSNSQANNSQCPANSKFASGTIDLVATAPGASPQDYTADLSLYVAPPQQAGDPAGAVFYFVEPMSGFHGSSLGRILNLSDPTYGTEILFSHLPLPTLPPGFKFDLKDLKLNMGAGGAAAGSGQTGAGGTGSGSTPSSGTHAKHRTGRTRRGARGRHLRPHAPRPAPVASASSAASFLANPASCTGTWAIRLQIGFTDGTQERDANAPCSTG